MASTPFLQAQCINRSLTAIPERHTLTWLAKHAPAWLTSDQLTALGLLAQLAAGLFYALARTHRQALLLVNLCILLNWLGDSLDGTLARVRQQQRPRFGFYVDHAVDLLGGLALMLGLSASGFCHPAVALGMLIAFQLLAAESYLATYTLGRFELSQGLFGPTEIRLLLITGNFALIHSPYVTLFHHHLLLFDLGGTIATTLMTATALLTIARHTRTLYLEEPIP